MTRSNTRRVPGIWQGVRWAFDSRNAGGGTSRARLTWRALRASLSQGKAPGWLPAVPSL